MLDRSRLELTGGIGYDEVGQVLTRLDAIRGLLSLNTQLKIW